MQKQSFTLRHSLSVILAIGWSDFMMKYRGTTFGYLWSLLPALTKFLAMLYVLGPYVSPTTPHYPLYLFVGLIIWDAFVMMTNACMTTLRNKAALIQKISFPHIILMFAVGWTHTIIFCSHLIIVFLFLVILHVPLTWAILYTPIIILQLLLLSLGIGMILSSYSLRFQDIPHTWDMLLQILFWFTPIAYPAVFHGTIVRGALSAMSAQGFWPWGILHVFVTLQPLSVILFDARRVLLYPENGIPSLVHTAVFTAIYACIFIVGLMMYRRRSKYFIQEF